MENDLTHTLLQLWVLWYASAAAFGAFFGSLAALCSFYGVRSLYRKIMKGKK